MRKRYFVRYYKFQYSELEQSQSLTRKTSKNASSSEPSRTGRFDNSWKKKEREKKRAKIERKRE